MRKNEWLQQIAQAADLNADVMPGIPLVEIAGRNRVLIECHRGVTEYSTERICVKVRFGCICVTGSGLTLTVISKERLVISGCINGVQLERRIQ